MADTKRLSGPMAARRPAPPVRGPSYAEGETIPSYRLIQEAPASPTPAPPPALAYPGDAKNVASQFHSPQFTSAPPTLSSTNMPPADRYAPATGFSPALNNYMNLAPSTELKKGGSVRSDSKPRYLSPPHKGKGRF
jgi:hypothetical protein